MGHYPNEYRYHYTCITEGVTVNEVRYDSAVPTICKNNALHEISEVYTEYSPPTHGAIYCDIIKPYGTSVSFEGSEVLGLTASTVGLSNAVNTKHNFTATVNPTISDDSSSGYSIGSQWINTSTKVAYECVDSTSGDAMWNQITNKNGNSSKYLSMYITSNILTIDSSTWQNLPWNYQDKIDTITYNHTSGSSEITVLETSTYNIECCISLDVTVGTDRSIVLVKLQRYTSGAWSDVNGAKSRIYCKQILQGGSTTLVKTINLTANDKLRVVLSRSQGTNTMTCVAEECSINILKVDALKGDTGDVGAEGAAGDLNWRGTWNSSTNYVIHDTVQYSGSSYVATAINTNSPPPSSDWNLVAAAGEAGINGDFAWRGTWNSITSYVQNDVVYSNGSSYVAIQANTNSVPPNANWDIVVEAGNDASLTVLDENTSLGTTFSKLNFAGNGVVATNAGSNTALITINTSTPIFGSNFQYWEDLNATSTTSLSAVDKMSVTTASLPIGTYRIGVSYIWRTSSTSRNIIITLRYDNTNIYQHVEAAKSTATDQRCATTFNCYITTESVATHTLKLQYNISSATSTAFFYTTRIELWRVM